MPVYKWPLFIYIYFFTFLQARENPEPIFEISDCALKNVPSGIYLLCKVFRKKELRLGRNKLSSLTGGGQLSDLLLLTVLDLSNNEFTNLPVDICCLTLLEVSHYNIFCLLFYCYFIFNLTQILFVFRSFICKIIV